MPLDAKSNGGGGDQGGSVGPGVAGERHQAVEDISARERPCGGSRGDVAEVDRPLRRRDDRLGKLGVSLVLAGHDYQMLVIWIRWNERLEMRATVGYVRSYLWMYR